MDEKQYYITLGIILLLLVSLVFLDKMTGNYLLVDKPVSVSVADKLNGKVTSIALNTTIIIGDRQDIAIEFANIGSVPFTETITARVHRNMGNFTLVIANYQDSPAVLQAGMRKVFPFVFVPNETGLYYVQARVTYESRVAEGWSAFYVVNPPAPPAPPPIYNYITPPPSSGGGGAYGNVTGKPKPGISGVPFLEATAQNRIDLHRDDSVLLPIEVTNKGDVQLTNIRAYVSTTSTIDMDVNPKVVAVLGQDEYTTFLVSLAASNATELGIHSLDYSVVSDQAQKSGAVEINVLGPETTADDLREKILNYQLLIIELDREIDAAKRKGFDVHDAEQSLRSAKDSLRLASEHLDYGDYPGTRDALDKTKRHIEDTAFMLANAQMLFAATAIDLFLLLVIIAIVLLALLIFIILKRRKKSRKRPEMLRRAAEEG
jgi:hypothetical protein